MRKEFCVKDGIRITYLEDNVAFEDTETTESILFANDGTILFNNFADDPEKTAYFQDYFHQIYPSVEVLRILDRQGEILHDGDVMAESRRIMEQNNEAYKVLVK